MTPADWIAIRLTAELATVTTQLLLLACWPVLLLTSETFRQQFTAAIRGQPSTGAPPAP